MRKTESTTLEKYYGYFVEKMCESLISIGTLLDAHDNTIQELYIQHNPWCSVSFICARNCKQLLLQMNRKYFVCSKWKPFGFTISIWGWIQRVLTGRKCCHLVCPPDDKLPCFHLEWLSGTLTYQMDNNGCLASLC